MMVRGLCRRWWTRRQRQIYLSSKRTSSQLSPRWPNDRCAPAHLVSSKHHKYLHSHATWHAQQNARAHFLQVQRSWHSAPVGSGTRQALPFVASMAAHTAMQHCLQLQALCVLCCAYILRSAGIQCAGRAHRSNRKRSRLGVGAHHLRARSATNAVAHQSVLPDAHTQA